jgi:thioredoxin reductase
MFDVLVIGGSYAGISAALPLARARRRIAVVDAGSRRNRFASHAHGILAHDGDSPGSIVERGRAQLLAYPTVTWIDGSAASAERTPGGFVIRLATGDAHEAQKLVLAHGVVDSLPDIPGLSDRWGRSVYHCPYCHGYELDREPIGVIASMPFSVHAALMLPDWGPTTYFTRGLFEPTDEERVALEQRGVVIERAPVAAVEGHADVRLASGKVLSFRGIFVAPRTRPAVSIAEQLGCALDESPMGTFVRTDAMKETTVPGVFACGDVAIAGGSVPIAIGDGARAGVAAHRSLLFPSTTH